MAFECQISADTLTFPVYVQPRSSATALAGTHLDALKIKLTAPPADNAANKQCCELLAKELSLPKSAVEIIAGHTSRHKRIRIRIRNNGPTQLKALAARLQDLAR